MARAGGAAILGAAEAQVLERLSPVFRVGGVLVGSHAFAVIGNSLGVRWQDAIPVTLAWKALGRRGKAWTSAANSSLRLLDPDLVAELRRLGVKG